MYKLTVYYTDNASYISMSHPLNIVLSLLDNAYSVSTDIKGFKLEKI